MIGAKRPIADDELNYSHVAAHRKAKGELRAELLEPIVLAHYRHYLDRLGEAGGPSPDRRISACDLEVLTENAKYLSLVQFSSLRADVLAAASALKCPYCYQLRASQVDHYLPKSQFGEYAIYAPNLVPICGECNGKKLDRYRRPGGGRRYLHPYFDQLPSGPTRYLAATLKVGASVTISYEVAHPSGMSDELWAILDNQFRDLDLGRRYMEEASEMMMNMLNSFYAHFTRGGSEELNRQLLIECKSKTLRYGVNHWWPTALSSLAGSTDFCIGGFRSLGPDPDPLDLW